MQTPRDGPEETTPCTPQLEALSGLSNSFQARISCLWASLWGVPPEHKSPGKAKAKLGLVVFSTPTWQLEIHAHIWSKFINIPINSSQLA